jgi:hypothetical protein
MNGRPPAYGLPPVALLVTYLLSLVASALLRPEFTREERGFPSEEVLGTRFYRRAVFRTTAWMLTPALDSP